MPIDLPEGVYSGFSIYGDEVLVPEVNPLDEHWSSPRLKPVSKKLHNWICLLQLEGECYFRINGKAEKLSNGHLLLFPKHKSLLKTIVNEHASPAPFSEQIARMEFMAFAYSLQDFVSDETIETPIPAELTQNPSVLLAIDLFEREYSELWDLKKLSDRLAVSESKLTKAFRIATGESPMASLWKIGLIKGDELMVGSSMNVTQLAMMVGFQSSQSFATAFKRSFKSTPRDVKNGTVTHIEPREFLHEQNN
jgi:AraC-like DNA-binding protein